MNTGPNALAHRVLVVDDEAMVRLLVVYALQEAGFVVQEAAEAAGALALLRADDSIRLMVTDVGLPGVDGWTLADQARDCRPDIQVLFMTGDPDAAVDDPARAKGFALIAKPFDLEELAARAGELLAP